MQCSVESGSRAIVLRREGSGVERRAEERLGQARRQRVTMPLGEESGHAQWETGSGWDGMGWGTRQGDDGVGSGAGDGTSEGAWLRMAGSLALGRLRLWEELAG